MASSDRPKAGARFGKYELIALLGRGGMGEVYEARDTQKGRIVALKILLEQYAQDPSYRSRFTREASAAASLQEPHVVPIHDWGEINGNLYIDMRLIRGTDLRSLTVGGPLDPVRAVHIIGQVASALDAAHAEGLIHRDIKPENIVVSGDDFAHLLDFGIAEKVGDTHLTQAGMTVGSWAYMAPERLSGDHATKSVDIYSLSCVLYEALTGARPFAIDSMQQVVNAHLYTPPPRASAANPRVPPSLDAVIERGMAKEPDDRYGSAGALARAAQRGLSAPAGRDPNATLAAAHVNFPTEQHTRPAPPLPAALHPPPPTVPPSRPSMSKPMLIGIAVCAALVLAVAGIAIGLFAGQSDDDEGEASAQNPSLTRLPVPERPSLPTGQRPSAPAPNPSPRRPAAPPPAVTGVDGLGQRCDGGFEVAGDLGDGGRAVRGSLETSCRFVDNVLSAYWDAGGPNASPSTIYAAGGVPCDPRSARCRGNLYVLECGPFGVSDWVTCRGGVNAVVHIY
ncbi:serine/threonine-protein kinase [Mycolicibacterium hippocampi]|uniref:serine/threonine-protein kinase n=1 Tax=Mycolicibacterium hippocampi TaxID=659824 RepID=UPI001EEDDF73|nr:serine/threonine-protein kinase [Mycolicibacterium hippocampi]